MNSYFLSHIAGCGVCRVNRKTSTFIIEGPLTRSTIDSRSEMARYGRNEHDIELQMELDKEHGKTTYAKHLLKWVGDRIGFINPTEVEVSYGDSHIIEPMTDEDIDEFTDRCLNDE